MGVGTVSFPAISITRRFRSKGELAVLSSDSSFPHFRQVSVATMLATALSRPAMGENTAVTQRAPFPHQPWSHSGPEPG